MKNNYSVFMFLILFGISVNAASSESISKLTINDYMKSNNQETLLSQALSHSVNKLSKKGNINDSCLNKYLISPASWKEFSKMIEMAYKQKLLNSKITNIVSSVILYKCSK